MPSGFYPRDRHKKPPRTKSGLRGVIFHRQTPKKPWRAYIIQHGMYRTIGYFATKLEAAIAYNKAAIRVHGADTFLNRLPPAA